MPAAKPDYTPDPQHSFEEKWELALRRYQGTIRTFARNFVSQIPGSDIEDIEQELLMILMKCVKNYDPDRGASFNTLFQGSAKNRCISLVRTANTQGRTAVRVFLDDEATATAVDEWLSAGSAEEIAMRRIDVRQHSHLITWSEDFEAVAKRGPKPKRPDDLAA